VISKKVIIAEKVQDHLDKLDWQAAISEMEKLFAIDRDPLIRVRIGDIRRKLNKKLAATREYIRAADLFAERGFIVKALAQYNLAFRLDPSNEYVRSRIEMMRRCKSFMTFHRETVEYQIPQSLEIMPDIFINI
jgi:tetratricopeptide (TPR) repeat protein